MAFSTITIIGLGLIGGSFAMALKERGFKGSIVGVSRTPSKLKEAKERGIIDRFYPDIEASVKGADLIMFCTNVSAYVPIMNKIMNHIKKGAIVSDVGSIKSEPVKALEAMIPEGVRFVGAHPIAGSEKSGIDAAHPNLFHRAQCIMTPTSRTDSDALNQVCRLWESVGAHTLLMSCDDHDMTFGAVSHLPHVIAYALINTITAQGGETLLSYGGPGLKDTTRIALSSPELWKNISMNNRHTLINMLIKFESNISLLRKALEDNDGDLLLSEFKKAQSARMTLE
jgi:prephenate dehydrogenase